MIYEVQKWAEDFCFWCKLHDKQLWESDKEHWVETPKTLFVVKVLQ